MGLEFGNLQRVVGITYFQLSPHEQRAMSGVLDPGFKNTLRRLRNGFFFITLPALFLGIVIKTSIEMNHESKRKNPADYINDV